MLLWVDKDMLLKTDLWLVGCWLKVSVFQGSVYMWSRFAILEALLIKKNTLLKCTADSIVTVIFNLNDIVAYLLHARTVEPQKQPLLRNARTQKWNNRVLLPLSRLQLDKPVLVNTQHWELRSLSCMLQLVARLHNNSDKRGGCFLCGPCQRSRGGSLINEESVIAEKPWIKDMKPPWKTVERSVQESSVLYGGAVKKRISCKSAPVNRRLMCNTYMEFGIQGDSYKSAARKRIAKTL
jgi:hypothetical protein